MVLHPKAVNVSKLKFSDVKLVNQRKTVYVNYDDGSRNKLNKLCIQTPFLYLPFGVGDNEKFNSSDSQAKRYDLTMSFRDLETDSKIKEMYDKIQEIEKRIVKEAFEKREEWLGEDYDGLEVVVSKMFQPIVKSKKGKDNRYPPSMKVRLPYDDKTNKFNILCKDTDNNEVDFGTIKDNLKGQNIQVIIELGSIWFIGGKYGCTWWVRRAKVESSTKNNIDFVDDEDNDFADDDDESPAEKKSTEKKPTPSSPKPTATAAPVTQVSEDEDSDEGEDSDEEEEAPPPPPAVASDNTAEAKKETVTIEEESEEEESDEESDDEPAPPPPPPPPVTKGTRKTTKKST